MFPWFLVKHLVKSFFLNLNAESECFFMFEFHNNRTYFFALIKSVSTWIKFALCPSCLLYTRNCLLHSKNLFFALSKTVHCFLIKIVHYFLHKLFLAKTFKCNNQILVYAENSEQFLWENSVQFYLMQKTNFLNIVSRFEYTVNMMYREQILLM